MDLEPLAERWQQALDAAEQAVRHAGKALSPPEREQRRRALAQERAATSVALERLAREAGIRPLPWLSPVPLTPAMLGLPRTVRACVFDVEGVLTDSGAVHAWAWGEVLDDLLLHLAERTGWHFVPFDRDGDYRTYLEGRSRLEGVHAFLESRGLRLPEGRPSDDAGRQTVCGLARRKGEILAAGLRGRRVAATAGARRYLQAAGRAGLGRAVVSASSNARTMLELAGIDRLVDVHVDGEVIRADGLRSRPAPDAVEAACRRLGVEPEAAVALTHTPAGIAAAHAAGLTVVGVADDEEADVLGGFGADRVVPTLAALLASPLLADNYGHE
jgi:HAD superfamily hydrolase (TIGR01509 family)